MKDDLVYLPKADKIITLDNIESIEKVCGNNYAIDITKKDVNVMPPELVYKTKEDMEKDFQKIIDNIRERE